jgi:hypothetical protein
MADLDPFGGAVTVGSITLRTPGLAGVAESYRPGLTGLRSPEMAAAEQTTAALEAALANENFIPQETVEIREAREVEVGAVATRSTSFAEPALVVEVPDPGEDWGQMLLVADEAGGLSWSFWVDEEGRPDTVRGRATRTYVVRRQVSQAPPPEVAATRSLLGAVGTKLLKVLVFPLIDPVIGEVGEFFARRWEEKKRPYGVRRFGADDYTTPGGTPLTGDDWARLGQGRSLLFVHGTFSRTHSAFGGLSRETVAELEKRYEGRVFAFDHFTLSDDPQRNVEEFLARMPDGARLDCDIVCHSRGGLVSRLLAEQIGTPKIRIGTIAFVAVPNHGTILTDAKHVSSFLDSYTNLLNLIPVPHPVEILEGVLTVVKQVAVDVLAGLDGLQSMRPGGPFLARLNRQTAGSSRYRALAANWEPTDPGLKQFLGNRVLDAVFQKAQNDLVVPTLGVSEANGSGLFPITDPHVFGPADGVSHVNFFSHPVTQEKLLEWLVG